MFIGMIALQRSNALGHLLKQPHVMRLIAGSSACLIFIYVVIVITYPLYPGFRDHMESSVAAISWMAAHGSQIYPSWTSGDVYGLLYGPMLFVVNGYWLNMYPSLTMAKIPGVVCCILSLCFFMAIIRARLTDDVYNMAYIPIILTVRALGLNAIELSREKPAKQVKK
jgi:hypothetical protein